MKSGLRSLVLVSRHCFWVLALLCLTGGLLGCASPDPMSVAITESGDPQKTTGAAPPVESALGVFDDRIVFGQSAAFSGPAQELGINMKLGIDAAFHEANQKGGVNGRRLELISLDDHYEPEAAIANTIQLIEEEQVFALIGAVGTPTSRSAVPVAASAGVPYIAPFTGAAFLRESAWGNIINLRASYNQETEEMVKRLTSDLGLERIAVVYQDDSFGRAGYQGSLLALKRRGMRPVATGLYPRNTSNIKKALIDISEGNPEAVILVGAYEPLAELIAWARYMQMNPIFVNISFVGSNALAQALWEKDAKRGHGVYVTQVVPFPTDRNVPVTNSYQQAIDAYTDGEFKPGFVSLEGYLAGRLAIAALERCGREVTRACLLQGLFVGEILDLGGFPLVFGANDNQGSDTVFLTVIGQDGQYHPVRTLKDEIP